MVGVSVASTGRTALTVTANGNAQVDTGQSKFGGASYLGDGTGDYLRVSGGTISIGTGDFTIEMWARHAAVNVSQMYMDCRPTNVNGAYPGIFFLDSNSRPYYYFNTDTRITANSAMSTNTWYHIAIVRSGGVTKMYINGTAQTTTYTNSDSISFSVAHIGASNDPSPAQSLNGHIDEVRISTSARYTANFTPATSAFVNDSNTVFLMHADGTDASTVFTDDNAGLGRTAKTLTANGNTQVDTAQSQFGGASALFDTSADWLAITNTDDLNTGTGDLTIEFWMRPTSRATSFPVVIQNREFDFGCIQITDRHNANSLKLQLWVVNYSNSTPMISSSTTITNGTWYHIAVSRSGSSWRLFVNGTQEGSTITYSGDATAGIANRTTIGNDAVNTADTQWNGHIDEVRWSNIARYTGNFTTATAPFVNDANTLLLIHANGADASTVFTDDNS
jgi:hypothetical protein